MARVLVVDDALFMRRMLSDILKKEGIEICGEAENGKDAIDKYQQLKPDLVTMDIVMPKMGGGQAYDCIKSINPAVKVLLLSGFSIDGEATQILSRGCNGFIQKPFNLEQLSRSVESVLTGNGAQKKGNGGTGLARGIRA